jgi:phage head maturation protease
MTKINYDTLAPGRYKVTDEGRVVKHSDTTTELVLCGIGATFGKPFTHGDRILSLESGCFDAGLRSGSDVSLILNHDESHCLGSLKTSRLQIYAGKEHLVFRYLIPESSSSKFAELADDFDCYVAVSAGFKITKSDTATIDGIEVTTVNEGRLEELSILSQAPAITSTFARVVSWQTCGTDLKLDYETGRFDLVGKYVSLHRKIKADVTPRRRTTGPRMRSSEP